jgi:hypothetical protein
MILRPNPVHSSRFHYSAIENTFSAEASDLAPISSHNGSLFGRVYDDACDEGLTLVSARTGREIVFVVEHVERDREGELLFWELLPADLGVRHSTGFKLRVYND